MMIKSNFYTNNNNKKIKNAMSNKAIFKDSEGFIKWITSIDTNVLQDLLNKFSSLSEKVDAIPDMKEIFEKINNISETAKNYIVNETSEIKETFTKNISSIQEEIEKFKNSINDIKEGIENKLKTAKILLYVTLSASVLSLILSIVGLFI